MRKTEKLIQVTENLKKGLLEQLLTKGIGHKKFKKTEIGEIPEEWEVKNLDQYTFINEDTLSEKTEHPRSRLSRLPPAGSHTNGIHSDSSGNSDQTKQMRGFGSLKMKKTQKPNDENKRSKAQPATKPSNKDHGVQQKHLPSL